MRLASFCTLLLSLPFLYGATYSYNPAAPDGPPNWGTVNPNCDGLQQSPINIVTTSVLPLDLSNLETTTSSVPSAQVVTNTEHNLAVTISADTQKTSTLTHSTLLSEEYTLLQYHYHSPSEHTVDGNSFDLEVHYVHQHPAGHLAVVGVLFNVGDFNADLEPLVAATDSILTVTDSVSATLDVLYPTVGGSFWHYSGSLTTPPCSEVVEWFVFQDVLTLSADQLAKIQRTTLADGYPNNRPVQDLNDREVYQKVTSFSYDETKFNGPPNWHLFWETCGGSRQSPIDIDTSLTKGSPLDGLSNTAPSKPLTVELENLQHTVEVVIPADVQSTSLLSGSTLLDDDYELIQFHYHSPSEHTVDGINFLMEAHYVHLHKGTGQLAVVGVFYSLEDPSCNRDLQPIVDELPNLPDPQDHADVNMTIRYPTTGSFWHYRGSLTTPPCSEIVDWFVYQEPQQICPAQLRVFIDNMDHETGYNNRPTQDLNTRTVYEHGASSSLSVTLSLVLCYLCFNVFVMF